ncbi:hypothetical protein ACFQ6C_12670 [Streptomyces sp. NPDC056454]|uniref:hypothetical protein n=1 Tax=Streptomyces sp. NPDC056454 TaxID=3345823 RepID=UPI003687DA24
MEPSTPYGRSPSTPYRCAAPTPYGHSPSVLSVRLLAALLLVLLVVPEAAADDGPGAPAGWTVRPAGGGSGGQETRPYVYGEATPATVLQDLLSVTNPARTPLTVRLRGDGPAGAGLRFAAETVTVPARTRADVPFALSVPGDAVPGDLAGEIVAVGGGQEERVPVRVRVGGPTLAALTVEDVEVSGRTIRYALVNRGNAPLRPRLAVRADGVFATLLDRPARPLDLELAPGRRVELTEPWPDVPALDSVTVRLRVVAEGGARDEAAASAVYVPVAPVVGGGLLALGVLALLGTGTYRRRRDGRGTAMADPAGTAVTGLDGATDIKPAGATLADPDGTSDTGPDRTTDSGPDRTTDTGPQAAQPAQESGPLAKAGAES